MSILSSSTKLASLETRQFAREQTDRLLGRLAFQISRAIKSHNPDAVHDLRVAIRRFVQALRVFKPCFRGKEIRRLRRELKPIMAAAGEVRNYDIALKLLAKSRRMEGTGLLSKIQGGRKEAERSLLTLLKRWVERKSSSKWRSAVASAAGLSEGAFATAPLAQIAQEVLPRLTRDFFERGNQAVAKASPAQLHRFRIVSKKFRYTLELFVSLHAPLQARLEAIRRIQSLLGNVNDCETVRSLVVQLEGTEIVAAWLKRRQRRSITKFREHWEKAFGREEERRDRTDLLEFLEAEPRVARKPAGRRLAESRPAARARVAVA